MPAQQTTDEGPKKIKTRMPVPSVVGAIVLALRIEDTLPVVCLVGLPRVGVDLDLNIAAQEGFTDLEHRERLGPAHRRANEAADEWRRGAPVSLWQTGEHIELCPILWVRNGVALDLAPVAQGCPRRRALVRNGKELAALRLPDDDVDGVKIGDQHFPRGYVLALATKREPSQGREDLRRGVAEGGPSSGATGPAAHRTEHRRRGSDASNRPERQRVPR